MSRVKLLTIEDTFLIEGRGIVITPDFCVPDGWKNRVETVTIVKPNGQQLDATAHFSLSQFNLIDREAPIDRRWRVVMMLPDRAKDDLPIGSGVLVSPELRSALLSPKAS
ncbi:MAG: hypothetical protein ACJ8C4_01215 [Gemmataceae bacterium]